MLNLGGSLKVSGIGITYLSLEGLDVTTCILRANGFLYIDFNWSGDNLGDEMMDFISSSAKDGTCPKLCEFFSRTGDSGFDGDATFFVCLP